ncbi:MAG: rRNA maturation RNase YbeY [Bacteroidetes bacterium]|nr:MAG: rRNA maturation RNase YbeY [Bacteroidota bacterium]
MQDAICFFCQDVSFSLPDERASSSWIAAVVREHGRSIHSINYIFCSDAYLLELNRQHLSHDYLTDILTFPYQQDEQSPLFSDIYISIERVRDNASQLHIPFDEELHRVMIHGVLHLLGYNDHTEEEKAHMRQLENEALSRRKS